MVLPNFYYAVQQTAIRDFKDTAYFIHYWNQIRCASNAILLLVLSCLAILRIEGCLNSTP